MMPSLEELCKRALVEEFFVERLHKYRRPIIIQDNPNIIDIFIHVMDNRTKTPYYKISDYQICIM